MPSPLAQRLEATSSTDLLVGTSLDIARATSTVPQATAASRLVGQPKPQSPGAAFGLVPQENTAWVDDMRARAAAAPPQKPHPLDPNVIGNWASATARSALTKEIAGVSLVDILHNQAVQGAIRVLEWGPELLSNAYESDWRTSRERRQRGDYFGSVVAGSGVGRMWEMWDPNSEWRRNWEKSVEAESSAFQTAWLAASEGWAAVDADAQSAGVVSDFDRMLDDPNARDERARYFSHGASRWTTGIGDALTQIFADPTLIGAKAGAVIKSARSTLRASDVSAAAAAARAVRGGEGGIDAAAALEPLTRKQQRAHNFIGKLATRLADADDPIRASRGLSESKFMRQSSAGAAISYAAGRAGAGLEGAAKVAAIEEVLYAGMGDAVAMARLTEKNTLLAVEIRRMADAGQPDAGKLAARATEDGGAFDPRFPDATHVRALTKARRILSESAVEKLEKDALTEVAQREFDSILRTVEAGARPTRVGGANSANYGPQAAGELGRLPTTFGSIRRGTAGGLAAMGDSPFRIVASKNYGRFIRPLHYLTGRHLPGVFDVTEASKSAPVFESAIIESKKLIKASGWAPKGTPPKIAKRLNQKFADDYAARLDLLALEFRALPPEAASKAARAKLVQRYNQMTDDIIGARLGLMGDSDVLEKMRVAHESIRGRRKADADDFAMQMQYAAQEAATVEGQRAVVFKGSDGQAYAFDPKSIRQNEVTGAIEFDEVARASLEAVPNANTPAFASQLQNTVALVDPQSLLLHAQKNFAGGLAGFVAKGATSRPYAFTQWLMHTSNYVWKASALMRIPAYTIRAMSDTLARNLVLIGGLQSLEMTLEGARNWAHNMRRVSMPRAEALHRRTLDNRALRRIQDKDLPQAVADAQHWGKVLEEQDAALAAALRELEVKKAAVGDEAAASTARGEEILDAVGEMSLEDLTRSVYESPERFERLVRTADDAAALEAEEISRRLMDAATDYREATEVRKLYEYREGLREEAARKLDEARARLDAAQDRLEDIEADAPHLADEFADEFDVPPGEAPDGLRFDPDDIDPGEANWEAAVELPEGVSGGFDAAARAEARQEAVEAARAVREAQAGLLRIGSDGFVLGEQLSAVRKAVAEAEAEASRVATHHTQAREAYEQAIKDLDSYRASRPAPGSLPRVPNPDRLDALLEAYRPTDEQLARLADASRPMRVVVTGSRKLDEAQGVIETLETFQEIAEAYGRDMIVVHGDSPGADRIARQWARQRQRNGARVSDEAHPANWDKHGSTAWRLRDDEIWEGGADVTLAFPGGDPTSVRSMRAKAARDGGWFVDGGIPTPEMIRRAEGERLRALRAQLDEVEGRTGPDGTPDAPTAPLEGPDFYEAIEYRRELLDLERTLREQNELYLRAQVAGDEAAGVKPYRLKSGKNKGQIRRPKRALTADEKRIKKNLDNLATRKAELEGLLGGRGGRSGEPLRIDKPIDTQATEDALRPRQEEYGWDDTTGAIMRQGSLEEPGPVGKPGKPVGTPEEIAKHNAAVAAAEASGRTGTVTGAELRARRRRVESEALRSEIADLEGRIAHLESGAPPERSLPLVGEKDYRLEILEAKARDAELAEKNWALQAEDAGARAAAVQSDLTRIEARMTRSAEYRAARQAEDEAWADMSAAARSAVDPLDREMVEEALRLARERRIELDEELARLEAEVSRPLEVRDRVRSKPWKGQKGEPTLRQGETVLMRRAGLGERIDRDGLNYRAPRETDPYRTVEEWRSKMASFDTEDAVMGVLYQGSKADLENLQRTGRWDLKGPTESGWRGAYLRVVNHHATKDPLARRMLDNFDDDSMIAWLKETDEGRRYFEAMSDAATHRGEATSYAEVVARARDLVDTLLPPGSSVRTIAAGGGELTITDIARFRDAAGENSWRVRTARPSVPYEMIEMAERGVKASQWANDMAAKATSRYFKIFAQMPEERMGRHPLYVARYQQHTKNYIDRLDGDLITTEQYDQARRYADREARLDMGRYMFDTSDKSNIGHGVQLLSPFYSAWEDSVVKWFRLLGENPEVIPMAWNIARAPNAAGMVVDNNGDPIDVYGNIRDTKTGEITGQAGLLEGNIIVPTLGLDLKGWSGVENFKFRKDSANVVFQGDPWWLPGPGPTLAIPTSALVQESFPELWRDEEDEQTTGSTILRWILPFGPQGEEGHPGVLESALPAWARTARDVMLQDGKRYDQVYNQLLNEQATLERLGEVPKSASDAERIELIANRTRNWFLMRLMGTQSPVSLTPESPLAFYRKEYQRMIRENPTGGMDLFRKEYPEYFDLTLSQSVSETGLAPTVEAWSAIQKYRAEIALDPEFGWFYAGAENLTGGFNQAVYAAQMSQQIDPTVSDETFRRVPGPGEHYSRIEVTRGWDEYNRIMTKVNLALEEIGLEPTQISRTGAAGIKEVKDRAVQDLKERYPGWAAEFGTGNAQGRVIRFLTTALKSYATHPELQERTDGQSLMRYLEMRNQVRDVMRQRREARGTPGFGSLSSAENDDLLAIWEQGVAELIKNDAGFEQMWNKVLSRDDLSLSTYEGGA